MRNETLCWSCRNACGGCSWSAYGVWQPVPGWEAEAVDRCGQRTRGGRRERTVIRSYHVRRCPAYLPDRGDEKEDDMIKWTTELCAEVDRLRTEGLTVPEIGERLGIEPGKIYKMIANRKARLRAQTAPKAAPEAAPEAPGGAAERDPIFDRMTWRALRYAAGAAEREWLDIDHRWREVLRLIEQRLDGVVSTARQYPETEQHYAAIAAILALGEVFPPEPGALPDPEGAAEEP